MAFLELIVSLVKVPFVEIVLLDESTLLVGTSVATFVRTNSILPRLFFFMVKNIL